MKSSLNIKKIALVILGASLVFSSCQRDGVEPVKYELTDDDKGFGSDHSRMEFLNEDVENIANMAIWADSTQSILTINGCQPFINHDTNLNKIVIDFGSGCPSPNPNEEVVRKGRIIVNYTMKYWDSGSVHTITFDDYYYDGVRLSGYKIIENRGDNNQGNPYTSIIVSDTLHLGSNLGYISYNSERERSYTSGWATPGNIEDDVFEVTGSGAIKRGNGSYCDFNILEALLVAGNCKNIKAGQLQLIPLNGDSRTINYGEGDCDDDAKLEIAGMIFDIKL
jgi:hypothetical protein